MKILVINEPFVKDFCRTQRWAARTRGRVLRAPDWLAYTTAVLENEGFDARLLDFPAEGWGKLELRDLISREQPEIVVLDSTTPSIYSDIECAKIAKENASCKVIMVGTHVSAVPEESLLIAEGSVDVVCRGEYEYSVRDTVKAFEKGDNLSEVLGISFRNNGGVIHNLSRPLIQDLDELPFPAWHHLDIMKYFDGGKLYPYMDLISGRGCPYGCIFCLWPQVMHGRGYRLRSPKNVVDEIEYDLAKWPELKKGEIFFEDDTFTVNRKRAIAICREIRDRGIKVTWSVNSRCDLGDLDLFQEMKAAGCRELLVGFENGDQQMLDNMHKKITVEDSKDFVKIAHKAGLSIAACFVLGLPGETTATLEKTIRFSLELGSDTCQYSAAIPYPGTEFYDNCKKNGYIRANSWADWLDDGEQSTIVEYPDLNSNQIKYYVDKGLKAYYLRPIYMINFILKTTSKSDLYRKLRGFRNYMSYLLKK